uniref:DNA-directed RNA polymerase III subunit RPC3 n=1 Tax=Aceria tosichella TaxID=561515 RepID=A0A6G1S5H3_9ACAR
MLVSVAHRELAYLLTKHYFNETVAKVIMNLFKYDQASMGLLRMIDPSLKVNDLKKALIILIKYQLVDYNRTIKSCDYIVPLERLFAFFRLPKFLHAVALADGEPTSRILRIVAERGTIGREALVNLSSKGYKETKQEITDIMNSLSARNYIAIMKENVYLRIERFDRDHRDDLITDAIMNFYNKEAKVRSICEAILTLSMDITGDDAPITAPIDLTSLHNALKREEFQNKANLELYLSKLTTEFNYKFFIASGNHPQRGPMFALNVGAVIDHLLKEHVCSVITTKFGPKCCRLFRILLQKGPLLLKQIEEIIMLPARDVREYSYMLNKENFIRNRQVPKTPDNAPGKSVFILSVEMDPIVYKIADLCCRSMVNLLTRYDFEIERNEPLLSRSRAVQDLLGVKEVTEEWNEYFNSHEMVELNAVNRNLDRLLLARNQVDETMFLCHIWLTMRKNMQKSMTEI